MAIGARWSVTGFRPQAADRLMIFGLRLPGLRFQAPGEGHWGPSGGGGLWQAVLRRHLGLHLQRASDTSAYTCRCQGAPEPTPADAKAHLSLHLQMPRRIGRGRRGSGGEARARAEAPGAPSAVNSAWIGLWGKCWGQGWGRKGPKCRK